MRYERQCRTSKRVTLGDMKALPRVEWDVIKSHSVLKCISLCFNSLEGRYSDQVMCCLMAVCVHLPFGRASSSWRKDQGNASWWNQCLHLHVSRNIRQWEKHILVSGLCGTSLVDRVHLQRFLVSIRHFFGTPRLKHPSIFAVLVGRS